MFCFKTRVNYIYIYIYCHPQTDCFVLSELFSVARHAGRSKPGSKPVQLYIRLVSDLSVTKRTTLAKRIFKVFILATAAAAFVYIFYTLSATRVLNSCEELCITLAAADNSFASFISIFNPFESDKKLNKCYIMLQQILKNQCELYTRYVFYIFLSLQNFLATIFGGACYTRVHIIHE